MTVLIKASTARKRADKVDRADDFVSNIASEINYRADSGYYNTTLAIESALADDVLAKLEKAGYKVIHIERAFYPVDCNKSTSPKGVVAKFLGLFKRDNDYLEPCFYSNPNYVEVEVSWAKEEELQTDPVI